MTIALIGLGVFILAGFFGYRYVQWHMNALQEIATWYDKLDTTEVNHLPPRISYLKNKMGNKNFRWYLEKLEEESGKAANKKFQDIMIDFEMNGME